MKNSLSTNICLSLATIQKVQSFLFRLIKKLLVKRKMNLKVITEFVGLKSNMYYMKNIDGKELNTAKGVNIATDFSEFKNTFFNKKLYRHKMRRIKGKIHKIGTSEINKISLSVFDDKRKNFVLNNGIDTLAYFHKD